MQLARWGFLSFGVFLARSADALVGQTNLDALTAVANRIVIGRVERVRDKQGLKLADLRVERTLKGRHKSRVQYLAWPTHLCDTAKAIPGERVLLFLTLKHVVPPRIQAGFKIEVERKDLLRITGEGGGRVPIRVVEGRELAAKTKDLLRIAGEGAGRMPIQVVEGKEYAIVRTGAVAIPASLPSVPGPDPQNSLVRLVPLDALVKTAVKLSAQK